jgi:nucleoside phosphorylase/CheY-like chemotaxis protein
MIRILVVDDKIEKQGTIVNVIKGSIGEREDVEIKTVTYVIDAKKILLRFTIDIMILDICLPLHPGDALQKDGGIKLLKEIKGSERYTYPRYVISLSEHEELTKEFSLDTGIIHTSIYYNPLSNEWSIRLAESIKAAVSIMENNIIKRSYDYDIAIICALSEELEYVKQSLLEVEEFRIPDDDYIFLKGYFVKDGRKIRVVIAQSTQKGMVPAAALTTKLIYNFAPKYVAMTGMAAGIKEKVNMGDAVVAEYVWDYGAGKEVIEENETIHRNTIEQIQLDTSMSSMVRHLSNNVRELAEIKQNFHGNKPDYELKLHIGAVATGAAVIANPQKVKEIQNQIRDVIAIEMEIFGVYYAARWSINPKPKFIAIKSICDFADEKKTDDFHFYASYVSAKILEKLAKEYFVYDD